MGDAIIDVRLVKATGQGHEEWFASLDAAGAREWDHKRIARWLGAKQEADAWWAEALALDYVRSRGIAPVEGTYYVTASKTLRLPSDTVWPFIDDDELRRSWLDCEFDTRGRTPGHTLRLVAADRSRIDISATKLEETASGEPRTKVAVSHMRLRSAEDVDETRAFWKAALAALAEVAGA